MTYSDNYGKPLFSEVLDGYTRYIKHFVLSFPTRHREDLIQEGLIGLYSACLAYTADTEAPFEAYAKSCIRNRICGEYKHISRDDGVSSYDEVLEQTIASESDIIGAAALRDYFSTLRGMLSETENTVLDAYLEDKTYEQIASCAGVTVKQVDNILVKIRKKIRDTYFR